MVGDTHLIEQITRFITENFGGAYDVYDISLRRLQRRIVLTIAIDAAHGVGIDDCEKVSRALSKHLDTTDPIPGRYLLEVSSPGAERLLKRHVDFERSVGRLVRWRIKAPGAEHGKEVFQARLHEVLSDRVRVSAAEGIQELLLDDVSEARTILEFPRKARG